MSNTSEYVYLMRNNHFISALLVFFLHFNFQDEAGEHNWNLQVKKNNYYNSSETHASQILTWRFERQTNK